MRQISPASLAKIAERRGTEPILLVQIQWADGGPLLTYSDRSLPGIFGVVLEVSNLENVVDVSGSTASQTITVKLDDSNGHFKTIFDNNDIHKRPVSVLQWFEGLPYSEAFLIFQGEISSPVVWNEGARTLSFEVVSRLEDKEVGFSVEEGDFPFLPETLVGKPWPLIFGTAVNVPALRIDDPPKGVLTDGTGITAPEVEPNLGTPESADLAAKIEFARTAASLWFRVALLASNTADALRFDMEATGVDLSQEIQQYLSLKDQFTARGNQFLLESQRMQRDIGGISGGSSGSGSSSLEKPSVDVAGGLNYPQGPAMSLRIRGASHEGTFSNNTLNITKRTHPAAAQQRQLVAGPITVDERVVLTEYREPLTYAGDATADFFAPGGTPVRVVGNYPIRYIASLNVATVLGVFAYRTFEDVRQLFQVPPSYYTVKTVTYGGITATQIELPLPLSSREEGWDDDLYVTVQGAVGPNVVDILQWLIQAYTDKAVDSVSFASVKTRVTPFPANFALLQRVNIVALLSEIAFQARCAIWLKNNTFYLKYLPAEDVAVETINETDVLNASMEVGTTTTEDLVTKFVAEWRSDYSQDKPNLLIARHNVRKYGTHERRHDFYIYNGYPLVEKATTFWLIRYANTWKKLSLKVPLTKLKLETYDTVTLDFRNKWVANVPVKAVVERCSFDPIEWAVSLTLWVPVRLGEMLPYPFATPADLDLSTIWPTPDEVSRGHAGGDGPGKNASGTFEHPVNRTLAANGGGGGAGTIGSPSRHRDWGDRTPSDAAPLQSFQTGLNSIASTINPAIPVPGDGTTGQKIHRQIQFKNFETAPFPNVQPGAFPGRIVSGQNGEYQVEVFFEGFNGAGKTVAVKQRPVSAKLSADTWVTVCKVVYKSNNQPKTELVVADSPSSPTFPGQVISGSGAIYQMKVFPNGTSQPSETVSATMLQTVTGDPIPPSSWTLVSKIQEGEETKYYMQFPLWL